MPDFSQKRREQLESSIQENLELLGKYRHRRNLSTDPRERNNLDDQIKDLNILIEAEQQELDALNEPSQPAPSSANSAPVESQHLPSPMPVRSKAPASKPSMAEGYERDVFVSYAWGGESERMVDELEQAFLAYGIRIVRDKKDLDYKGSIKDFERRIAQGQCIVVVISDRYMQSEHCMYELVEADKNRDLRERIFPIVLRDAKIFRGIDRLRYVHYWDEQIDELNTAIRNSKSVANLSGITGDLDTYMSIRASIDHLTDLLHDMNTLTPEMHTASGFSTLIAVVQKTLGGTEPPRPASNTPANAYFDSIREVHDYLEKFERRISQGASNLNVLFTAQGKFEDLGKTVGELTQDLSKLRSGTAFPTSDLKRISELCSTIYNLIRSAAGLVATGKDPAPQLSQISRNLPLLRKLIGQLASWLDNHLV